MGKKLFGWLPAVVLLIPIHAATAEETAFHLTMIKEVFGGSTSAPNAQYIMLQMYFAGENFVSGHRLIVFDSAGTPIDTFTFSSSDANGNNQAVTLIATPACTTFFHVPADLVMDAAAIPLRGGKICFDAIDCVSWGNYAGSSFGTGTPFHPCGGLESGKAVRRRTDVCGSSTLLDFCDDTDNSASDFRFVTPAPRNNANQNGTIPPSTCGNGNPEGLEQCDDGNAFNGDGCNSLCEIEPPRCFAVRGDLTGDGQLRPSDVVKILNFVFLGSCEAETCFLDADVNCDGNLSPADVVLELNAVFLGASLPC